MSKKSVVGDWAHAHERDRGDWRYYVSAAAPLPPSRGRRQLSFMADGSFVEAQPGADDRLAQATGTYELDGKTLVLRRAVNTEPSVYETVLAADGKSLKLRKM